MATVWTNVDVDVDVTVDEFIESCTEKEIKEVITALTEDGYLRSQVITDKMTNMEVSFREMMEKISDRFYSLDATEIQTIERIYKKYC
jgi:hypothetical protein